MKLDRRTRMIVTGGTRGIGAALVRLAMARGVHVGILARSAAPDRLPPGAVGCVVDLADPTAASAALRTCAAQLGGLDVLVNNAGIQHAIDFSAGAAGAAAAAAEELAVNLLTPIALCQAALAHMGGRPGAIVNVSSGLAYAPKASAPVYSASKAGLSTFSTALRFQLRNAGRPVTVCEAILPLVDTDMTRGRGSGKISAEAAARAILRAVEREQAQAWIGKTAQLRILLRLAPNRARNLFARS